MIVNPVKKYYLNSECNVGESFTRRFSATVVGLGGGKSHSVDVVRVSHVLAIHLHDHSHVTVLFHFQEEFILGNWLRCGKIMFLFYKQGGPTGFYTVNRRTLNTVC